MTDRSPDETTIAESPRSNGWLRVLSTPHGVLAFCGLALLLAVAGLLAPLAIGEMHRQDVIAEVQNVGEVVFDPNPRSRWGFIGPWLPERLHGVRSVAIGTAEAHAREFDFGKLQYLPELRSVLAAHPVGADQMLALPPLDHLKALLLYLDDIGDDAVRHAVNTYPNLEVLFIIGGPTDASIPEICRLKDLKLLNLGASKISTRALCELAALKHLEMLFLWPRRPPEEQKQLEDRFTVEWGPERILD